MSRFLPRLEIYLDHFKRLTRKGGRGDYTIPVVQVVDTGHLVFLFRKVHWKCFRWYVTQTSNRR